MNTEHIILIVWLLTMAVGILVYAVTGFVVVRMVARWLGSVIADVVFGRQPGGRR